MFEAFFANDGAIAKRNLPTAVNLTLALAQAKEQQYAISKGGVDHPEGVQFGSGAFPDGMCDSSEPGYVRGLRELYGAKENPPELQKVIEVCGTCLGFLSTAARMLGLLSLQTRAKMLLGQDVAKMSDEVAPGYACALVIMEQLQYPNIPEAQLADLTQKAIAALNEAEKAPDPPEPDPANPDAPVVQPEAPPPNVHFWTGIARSALMTGQFKTAEECAVRALSASTGPSPLEDANAEGAQISPFSSAADRRKIELKIEAAREMMKNVSHDPLTRGTWRWQALAEAFMAQAILNQIQPERQDFGIQNKLRRTALDHFGLSTKYGRAIGAAELVLNSARLAWNAALPNLGSEITRRMLMEPLQVVVDSLMAVEATDPEVMQAQPGVDMELKVSLYRLLLKCYEDKGKLDEGIKLCDKAIAKSLPAYQKSLWEAKMVMMSKVGRNVQGELARLKEANPVLQARLLSKLARSAKRPSEQVASIQKILVVLGEKPLEQVDFIVQLAECLFANSCANKDVQDQIMNSIDALVDLDLTVDPDDDGAPGGALGDGSQASGSLQSGTRRSSQMKSSVAGSQKSGGAR